MRGATAVDTTQPCPLILFYHPTMPIPPIHTGAYASQVCVGGVSRVYYPVQVDMRTRSRQDLHQKLLDVPLSCAGRHAHEIAPGLTSEVT